MSDMWTSLDAPQESTKPSRGEQRMNSTFLPSTFRRTPFGRAGLSPMDPYVSALAAASIVRREGWRQWACKPRSAS